MALENPWVGYLDRSYIGIKNSILKRLGESTPEITDHSESNILVIIVSMFAGVAEMLNYYIDNMAREAFITTARRYSSIVKLSRLIDYRIKATIPASTNINILFVDNVGLNKSIINNLTIPLGTTFRTNNGIVFISTIDITANVGDKSMNIPVEQKTFVDLINIGLTTALFDQVYEIGNKYVHNSLDLYIGGEPWDEVDTLGRSGPDDKHYIVEITVDKKAIIKFGDNINGKVPEPNKLIEARFYVSEGILGNVDANTINTTDFTFNLTDLGISDVIVNNPNKAVGGTDYESADRIKRSAPLHIRTLERAVTKKDYQDIAMLAPGVDKATVHFECGKNVEIYISPNGGGIASSTLIQNTEEFFDNKKMITTFVKVKPAGESEIILDIEVWAKFRRDPIQTKSDIVNVLNERYGYSSSSVNRKIRLSDIIALIDNLDKVDYLKLKNIWLKPYFRALTDNTNELLHNLEITSNSTEKILWRLQYDGIHMRLMKNNNHAGNIIIGTQFTDPDNIIKLTILPNSYQLGNEWEFVTYRYNDDIAVDDFTVPVINIDRSNIVVNKQIQ